MSFLIKELRTNGYRCCCLSSWWMETIEKDKDTAMRHIDLIYYNDISDCETKEIIIIDNEMNKEIVHIETEWSYGPYKGMSYEGTRVFGHIENNKIDKIYTCNGVEINMTWIEFLAQINNKYKVKYGDIK